MQRNLPNYITLLNLFCGFLGILCCLGGDLVFGGILVFAGAFFDLFDGLAARALKVNSQLGKHLDSLADVVTFGVLPSVIIHLLLLKTNADWLHIVYIFGIPTLALIPFAIVAGAAWRLAKFNIDDSQSRIFKGLPTPANGLFFASIPLMLSQDAFVFNLEIIDLSMLINEPYMPFLLIGLSFLFMWLMVSRIPLFSFKISDRKSRSAKAIFLFAFFSVVLFVFLLWAAVPVIIFMYLILSLIIKPGNEVQSAD